MAIRCGVESGEPCALAQERNTIKRIGVIFKTANREHSENASEREDPHRRESSQQNYGKQNQSKTKRTIINNSESGTFVGANTARMHESWATLRLRAVTAGKREQGMQSSPGIRLHWGVSTGVVWGNTGASTRSAFPTSRVDEGTTEHAVHSELPDSNTKHRYQYIASPGGDGEGGGRAWDRRGGECSQGYLRI